VLVSIFSSSLYFPSRPTNTLSHSIGLAFNALPGQNLRVDFESWAEAEYPKLLEELRKKGRRGPPQRPGPYKISQELKA